MVRLYPLKKSKREDAVRGNKEGRKVIKQRISRRKLYEEACRSAVWKNILSRGVNQVLRKLGIDYMKGTHQNWGRELRWLDKQCPYVIEYYIGIVEDRNKEVDYINEKRQEIIKIVARGHKRQQISWEINLSIEKEKDYEIKSKWRLSKQRQAACCVEGSKKLIMS